MIYLFVKFMYVFKGSPNYILIHISFSGGGDILYVGDDNVMVMHACDS